MTKEHHELFTITVKRLARAGIKDPTAQIVALAEEIDLYRAKIQHMEGSSMRAEGANKRLAPTNLKATAVCPFYSHDTDTGGWPTIVCEGVYSKVIRQAFRSKAEKNAHALNFCACENYKKCELYRLNMKKYEE